MTADPSTISADQAIDEISRAGGDQLVAAERLGIQREQLAGIIASDPLAFRRLQDQMRVLTLLDAQQTYTLVNVAVRGSLETLEGKDLVSLLGRLSETIGKLTDDKTTTTNTNLSVDGILRLLPPNVRESLIALNELPAPEDDDPSTIDGVFSSNFERRYDDASATIYDSPASAAYANRASRDESQTPVNRDAQAPDPEITLADRPVDSRIEVQGA